MFTLRTKVSMAKAVLTKQSPFYIQFYVSNKCHLNCKMCNIVESNSDKIPFSGDHIDKISSNLRKIGAGVVLLTGGEPLLRKDIDKIVHSLKKQDIDVRMQTAGLIERKDLLVKSVKNGARDINVSMDTLKESLGDYINGLEGSWMKAIDSISFISKEFPKKDSICALGCVLSNYNLYEIDALLDFATEIGWWLSLVPVHLNRNDNNLKFRGYDQYFSINEKDYSYLEELIKRLKYKKRHGFRLFDSDDYLDSIIKFVEKGKPSWRNNNICDSPNLYFIIQPDGSIGPCCDYELSEKIYVYDDDFPEKYKSGHIHKLIEPIKSQCDGCNFGSFPEMTLSARSVSTIKERVMLQLKANNNKFKSFDKDELVAKIDEIKGRYDFYKKDPSFHYRERKWER